LRSFPKPSSFHPQPDAAPAARAFFIFFLPTEATMTTTLKTTARTFPGFATLLGVARVAFRTAEAGWAVIRNRRRVRQLGELDDYLLADMGLTRADLREAYSVPIHHDPSLRLAVLVHEHRVSATECRPRGRRGDAAAPPSLWRAS
jgi:uncharacterized protein YjiS (DUF1127 family)